MWNRAGMLVVWSVLVLCATTPALALAQAPRPNEIVQREAARFLIDQELRSSGRIELFSPDGLSSSRVGDIRAPGQIRLLTQPCATLGDVKSRARCALETADAYVELGVVTVGDDSTRLVVVTAYRHVEPSLTTPEGIWFIKADVEVVRSGGRWRASRMRRVMVP